MDDRKIRVGIGFATGRKHFQRTLRSYVYNWKESGLVDDENISLNLFIAYDLSYKHTKKSDYTAIHPEISELLDSINFIGAKEVEEAKTYLAENRIVSQEEASAIFGKGYSAQRNIILYYAVKNKIDYLLFLDDDEYPMAVTKNAETALWSGQHILKAHLDSIGKADITYGYHCGYISPIPFIDFSQKLKEEDFRSFILAISNDIVNWENISRLMKSGGVSYADTTILSTNKVEEVPQTNGAKFISGSNLCINLTEKERIYPFYNPPGARGEDTFLSTCLAERKVLRVPSYAFHDGFSAYNQLLSGALPTTLKAILPDNEQVIKRFYTACVGWVRYKPLLLYISDPDSYQSRIDEMLSRLEGTLPSVCDYFSNPSFHKVLPELRKYHRNVELHHALFLETKRIWAEIMKSI
jgi:hypothetical protein